jgi:N-methylhydantoinase B/oxoprolinase/acetone carboxylase alpha subunit
VKQSSPAGIEGRKNVRTPTERQSDLRAQSAANQRGAQRLKALARKCGAEELVRIMDEVLDYSGRMMLAALRRLPDGEASFADVFDGDGVIQPGTEVDQPFTVKLTIRKRGDEITVDFRRVGRAPIVSNECAADGDSIVCAEIDRRSAEPHPAEFGLLAWRAMMTPANPLPCR